MTASPAGRGTARRWARALAEVLEPEENPSGVIYGTIAAGALLAAEATRHESIEEAAGAVALTLALFWLAHGYAHSLGRRLGPARVGSARQVLVSLRHEAAIMRGALLPLVVLLLTRLAGAPTSTAVSAALVSAAVLLFLLELIAGVRSRQGALRTAVQTGVGAVLGLGILALKIVLH